MGSEFEIFGGFGRVGSLVLVEEPRFRGVQNSVFPYLGLGSAHFRLNRFEVWVFWVQVGSKFGFGG